MATVSKTREQVPGRSYRTTWSGLGSGDVGEPAPIAGAADRTVQVTGTLDGATVTFEASCLKTPSLTPGSSDWFPVTDLQGNAISFVTLGAEMVVENAAWYRPRVVGGTSPSVTVTLVSRSTT